MTPMYEVRVGGRGTGIVLASTADRAGNKMVRVMGFKPEEYFSSIPGYGSQPIRRHELQAAAMSQMTFTLHPSAWTWPYLLHSTLMKNAGVVFASACHVFECDDYLYTSLTIEELKEKGSAGYCSGMSNGCIQLWMCLDWEE